MHESLVGAWWIAELVPKLTYDPVTKQRRPQVGLGRHRELRANELIDESVLRRVRDAGYAPPNFSARFIAEVKALSEVPRTYPYGGLDGSEVPLS